MTTTLTARGGETAAAQDAPLKVLIADDHPLFRRGIARAIQRHPGLDLVGEATDGREALALIAALAPDVAVLDHRMPELSGVEVCAQLALRPDPSMTAVLLLSAFEDAEIVAAAVRAGAAGYVAKTASQAEICTAIERAGTGGVAFSDSALTGVHRALRARHRPARGTAGGSVGPLVTP
jgi:two-component system nitrate/nitrite response regulator NarL